MATAQPTACVLHHTNCVMAVSAKLPPGVNTSAVCVALVKRSNRHVNHAHLLESAEHGVALLGLHCRALPRLIPRDPAIHRCVLFAWGAQRRVGRAMTRTIDRQIVRF